MWEFGGGERITWVRFFWDSGIGHLLSAVSLVPKVSEASEKLLMVPTPQSSLTVKCKLAKFLVSHLH